MKSYRKHRKRTNNTALLSSTKKAVKQTRTRVKKRLLSLLQGAKKSMKGVTKKLNTTVAKKIRLFTK